MQLREIRLLPHVITRLKGFARTPRRRYTADNDMDLKRLSFMGAERHAPFVALRDRDHCLQYIAHGFFILVVQSQKGSDRFRDLFLVVFRLDPHLSKCRSIRADYREPDMAGSWREKSVRPPIIFSIAPAMIGGNKKRSLAFIFRLRLNPLPENGNHTVSAMGRVQVIVISSRMRVLICLIQANEGDTRLVAFQIFDGILECNGIRTGVPILLKLV